MKQTFRGNLDKQRKKKILFVINTMGHAGAETALIEMMKQFDPRKYELSLYVLLGQGEMIERIPKYVKLLNQKYDSCSVLDRRGRRLLFKKVRHAFFVSGNGLKQMPALFLNACQMLYKRQWSSDKLVWRLISDGAGRTNRTYDLAIAYLEGGATYYVADHVKAHKKAAFIHTLYDAAGYTRELDQDCYAKYDQIFTVSEQVRTHFLKTYPEYADKTYAFHNIINAEYIRQRAQEPGGFLKNRAVDRKNSDPSESIKLLTVARLTASKAYEYSIQAMKILKQRGIQVTWYVLGEGPQRRSLERLIHKYGLDDSYILLGAVDNPFPYYRQADIYVHASKYEGKSIAIQEAQILGKPIIATDLSGNGEQVIDGENGIVCDLNPVSIADSIEFMIRHPQQRMSFCTYLKNIKFEYPEDMEKIEQLLFNKS